MIRCNSALKLNSLDVCRELQIQFFHAVLHLPNRRGCVDRDTTHKTPEDALRYVIPRHASILSRLLYFLNLLTN